MIISLVLLLETYLSVTERDRRPIFRQKEEIQDTLLSIQVTTVEGVGVSLLVQCIKGVYVQLTSSSTTLISEEAFGVT